MRQPGLPTQPDMLPSSDVWLQVRDGNPSAQALYNRHYSSYAYKDGRDPAKIVGPGEYIALLSPAADALFVWRKFISLANQQGVNCAVFRNESDMQSSDMILEAEKFAVSKWGRTRAYTYIDGGQVESPNPGYCFLMAGWARAGYSKARGLLILEKYLEVQNA